MSQVEIIRYVQSMSNPITDIVFVVFTMLGSEEFFMIILGAIYWCVDKRKGFELTLIVTGAYFLNGLLKELFRVPRPSPQVVRVLFPESASGYAFPSGHTQSATTFWGIISSYFRVRWLPLAAIIAVPMVAISRVYLGVHWPLDVMGGLLLGVATLALLPALLKLSVLWSGNVGTVAKVTCAILVPLSGLMILPGEDNAKMAGIISGFILGAMAETRLLRFRVEGGRKVQIQKFLLGSILAIGTRVLLKLIISANLVGNYIRYTAIGVAGAFVAPVLFIALGLSDRERHV